MSLAEIPPFTDSSPAVLRTAAENVEPRTMADDDREHDSHTHNEKNCRHCGLPLPPSDHAVTEEHAFCCAGCKTAFALISSEGLNEYYALRQRFADGKTQAVSPELIDASFIDLDAPRFWEHHVLRLPDGSAQVVLRLQGIHCAACVWLLERLPQIEHAIIDSRVNLPKATIQLTWRPDMMPLSAVASTIGHLGYKVVPLVNSKREREQRQVLRKQLIQIAIAGACSGNVMLLAIAIYCGQWTGMAVEHLQLLRLASTVVGLVSLLGPGAVFFRGAWAAIRARTSHMDLPIALGLGVGAVSGAWNTLTGSGELYYDSLSMLVFFLLIGRALQSWQQRSACESVDLLQQLTPAIAVRVRDGQLETIAIDDVNAGDTLEVRSGQTMPVDGTVVYGSSEVDTSLLTGESKLQTIRVGSQVIAGTLNRTCTVRVRADRVGAQTRLAKLLDSIERAGISKAPVVQWADRISGIFVTVVLCLAVVVGVSWWFYDRSVWNERVIAVLIVACPCALGLATPLSIAVALGRSARQGILIKGGDTLQRLSTTGILVLDKTGTLTTGHVTIHEWFGSTDALRYAAALESQSNHPVAQAVMRYFESHPTLLKDRDARVASDRNIRTSNTWQQVSNLTTHMGSGVSGYIDEHQVLVGNLELLNASSISMKAEIQRRYDHILKQGLSPLLVAVDGEVQAIAAVGDDIRPEARRVISQMEQRGWQVHILSGDHGDIVAKVGNRLGLKSDRCRGNVSPEGKLQAIRVFQSRGLPVMMVGDGVNDAAALAAADVGIAVRGGAEASMQAADVYLSSGSLEGILTTIDLSRRALRVIRRNSSASLIYNITSVTLAAIGWLHPLAAALLMPASSLTVVSVTLWGYSRKTTSAIESTNAQAIVEGQAA